MKKNYLYYVLEYTDKKGNICEKVIPARKTNLKYDDEYTCDETMLMFNQEYENREDLIYDLLYAINHARVKPIIPEDIDASKIKIYVAYKKDNDIVKMPVIFKDSKKDSKKAGIFSKNEREDQFYFNYYRSFKSILNKILIKQYDKKKYGENNKLEKLEEYRKKLVNKVISMLDVQLNRLDERCSELYSQYNEKLQYAENDLHYYQKTERYIEDLNEIIENRNKDRDYYLKRLRNLNWEMNNLNPKTANCKLDMEAKLKYILDEDLFIKPSNKNLVGLGNDENSVIFLYVIANIYNEIKDYNTDVELKNAKYETLCNQPLDKEQYSYEELLNAKEKQIIIEEMARELAASREDKSDSEYELQRQANLFNNEYETNLSAEEYQKYLDSLENNNPTRNRK